MTSQTTIRNVAVSRETYLRSLNPTARRRDWHYGLQNSRRSISDALRASSFLRDVEAALQASGKHALVFRHLLAPPQSQDQFKLLCPKWPKSSERDGNKGLDADTSHAVAATLHNWFDPAICAWLKQSRQPTVNEIRRIFERASCLITANRLAIDRRNRLAACQEGEVVELLLRLGWQRQPSKLVDTRAALDACQFMHKTRFATKTQPQEVDIACGLGDSYVLAMECKVTNDETNSVKRVNDVLKKAGAWRAHWGSFVRPAALLQGVLKESDVQRLIDEGVLVFWSHDLQAFRDWVESETKPS